MLKMGLLNIFIESMHFQRDGLADGIIHFSKSSIGKNIEKYVKMSTSLPYY